MKSKPIKIPIELKGITVNNCVGKDLYILSKDLWWNCREDSCEMCGLHSDIRVSFTCDKCNKEHTISVYSS